MPKNNFEKYDWKSRVKKGDTVKIITKGKGFNFYAVVGKVLDVKDGKVIVKGKKKEYVRKEPQKMWTIHEMKTFKELLEQTDFQYYVVGYDTKDNPDVKLFISNGYTQTGLRRAKKWKKASTAKSIAKDRTEHQEFVDIPGTYSGKNLSPHQYKVWGVDTNEKLTEI